MKNDFDKTMDSVSATNLRTLRKTRRENQTEFWHRFGVTQSSGSRFEKGDGMPPSVAILLGLFLERKICDADLQAAIHHTSQASGLEVVVRSALQGER